MSAFGQRRAALIEQAEAGELPAALSSLTDAWLTERFEHEAAACGLGESNGITGVALVAVGGYARGELCPGSDIDLLLLHDGSEELLEGANGRADNGADPQSAPVESLAAKLAERLWYPIWDEKLKLGHAVRTVNQALALAATDIDTATALADARHLAGDPLLTERLVEAVRADWRDNAEARLRDLARAVSRRHSQRGEVAFRLEPDLKTGRGGLRDAQAIGWAELAGITLPDSDRERLNTAYRTLLRARVELHRTTGLRSDVLGADDQDAVAQRYGAADGDAFMAEIASAGRVVAFLGGQLWSSVARNNTEAAAPNAGPNTGPRTGPRTGIDDISGLSLVGGELVIEGDPAADVVLILHAAVQSARTGVPIARASLDKLAQRQPPFPDPWPHGARQLLVELLSTGKQAIGVIETLDFFDLWTRVLPEWAPNRNRPQRSRYHRFTVDRHLLEAAAEAARFTHRVARPDLLLMGALLHDIGKGYPGDHTEAGVRLVGPIMRRCGWSAEDAEVVVRLVQHHLLLTDMATRRDLDDPLTIEAVARAAETQDFLELLAVLTEADCTATGPMAWSDWTASLVSSLVELTSEHLSGANADRPAHRRLLTEEVVGLMAAGETALRTDGDVLTVVAPDERGLFSRAAGVLALRGLDVLAADAYSSPAGMAVSSFRIVPPDAPVDWARVTYDVRRSLRGHLALEARIAERARVYGRRRPLSANRAATRVSFDAESATDATILEVRTEDHIGVLYRVTRVLAEMGLDIRSAKVQTLANEVVDAFYVLGPDGPVIDEAHQREVELALRHALA